MDTFQNQDRDPEIRRLGGLLRSVAPPPRTEEDDAALAERVLAEIHAPSADRPWLPSWLPVGVFSTLRQVRVALPAALALIAAVGLVMLSNRTMMVPLSPGRVIRIHGHAWSCETREAPADRRRAWEPLTVPASFVRGKTYLLDKNASVTVVLDDGSRFVLSSGAEIRALKTGAGAFRSFLASGTLTARVKGPRKSPFVVMTPNARCEVKGTRFRVDVEATPPSEPARTALLVTEGAVMMKAREGSAPPHLIETGQRAMMRGAILESLEQVELPEVPSKRDAWLPGEHDGADPADAPALLSLASRPAGADVFLDGKPVGQTPLMLEEKAGRRTVSMTYLDHEPVDTIVTAQPGRLTSIEATLEPTPPRPRSSEPDRERGTTKPAGKRRRSAGMRSRPTPAADRPPRPRVRTRLPESFPEYKRAQAALRGGNHEQALRILDNLSRRDDMAGEGRMKLLEEMSRALEKQGRYEQLLSVLERMYAHAESDVKRDNLLWRIASVRRHDLGDLHGAEMDLVAYLIAQPDGIWIDEAYLGLAQIQYRLGKYDAAARTYRKLIDRAPSEAYMEQAMFALAHILTHELDNCRRGLPWYSRLLDEYDGSPYMERALFWKAECLRRLGQVREAREAYRRYLSLFPGGRWIRTARAQLRRDRRGRPEPGGAGGDSETQPAESPLKP